VAPPSLRTGAWIAGALLAGGALLAVALHGERPAAGLARFQPAGVMVALAPERVAAVEVLEGARRWRYLRTPSGWAAEPGGARGPRDPAPLIDLGLRLLHGSVPQRVLEGEDLRGLRLEEIGLAPPLLVVRVEVPGAAPFSVDIGGPNPQGLARYARVAGRAEVLLLNRFVAEPWQELGTAP